MSNRLAELRSEILSHAKAVDAGPLLKSALNGSSDMFIASSVAKRLGEELERDGKDTFTMGDLRRVRNEMLGAPIGAGSGN